VTEPLAEVFSLGDCNVLDFVLSAESLDELEIRCFSAIFSNDNEKSLFSFNDSEDFVETLRNGILAEGALDNLGKSVVEFVSF
jgi:hypothetical protein